MPPDEQCEGTVCIREASTLVLMNEQVLWSLHQHRYVGFYALVHCSTVTLVSEASGERCIAGGWL